MKITDKNIGQDYYPYIPANFDMIEPTMDSHLTDQEMETNRIRKFMQDWQRAITLREDEKPKFPDIGSEFRIEGSHETYMVKNFEIS